MGRRQDLDIKLEVHSWTKRLPLRVFKELDRKTKVERQKGVIMLTSNMLSPSSSLPTNTQELSLVPTPNPIPTLTHDAITLTHFR